MNPAWDDAEMWRGLVDGSRCPICLRGKPSDVLAELSASWVTGGRAAPLPGYVAIVSKRHVIEPFELSVQEQMPFWQDAMRAARALVGLFKPIKMNYEIHGNTVPHLHMHLYPRTMDDPFADRPIDPRKVSFTRSDADLQLIRRAVVL